MGKNRKFWEQHGYAIFPRAVTAFYVLRYLQWIRDLPADEPFPTHHQYLWDIRMYGPVYDAFSEILGTKALWANLDAKEPAEAKGRVCLVPSSIMPKGANGAASYKAGIGDLLIYDATRCGFDAESDPDSDCRWLSVTLMPASEHEDSVVQKRIRGWNAKTCRTHLSSTGRKLLGLERWSAAAARTELEVR